MDAGGRVPGHMAPSRLIELVTGLPLAGEGGACALSTEASAQCQPGGGVEAAARRRQVRHGAGAAVLQDNLGRLLRTLATSHQNTWKWYLFNQLV